MTLHAGTQTLLSWAKRVAKARGRSVLGLDDLACALVVLSRDSEWADVYLPGDAAKNAIWPEHIEEGARLAMASELVIDKFPFDPALKSILDEAYALDPSCAPEALLAAMKVSQNTNMEPMLEALGLKSVAPKELLTGTWGGLQLASRRTQDMMAVLGGKVLGQANAIGMLGEAFFKAQLGIQGSGPKGVFTFLGPPGVGKTMLAQVFAEALADVRGGSHAFKRFDLAEFSGAQSHEQLFGCSKFYRDSRPGVLTGFVKEHPASVILFDELEKAHPNTHTALLSLLDSGQVVDQHLSETIDFSKTWIILTTNLGQEFLKSGKLPGTEGPLGVSSSTVFEIIARAEGRDRSPDRESHPILPKELVSRLAKGSAVLFGDLGPRHYLQLVDRGLAGQFEGKLPDGGAPLPRIKASEEAKLLFLLSMAPTMDARRVQVRSLDWAVSLVRLAYDHLRDSVPSDLRELTLDVRCSEATIAFLESLENPLQQKVLLLDEDLYLESAIHEALGKKAPLLCRVQTPEEAQSALTHFKPDLAVLDLSILEELTSPRIDRGLELLRTLRTADPTLPVYLFSENPHQRPGFENLPDQVLRSGGAHAYIPLKRDPNNPVEQEHFLGKLNQILTEARRDRMVQEERRRHRCASWSTSCSWDPEALTIRVILEHPTTSVQLNPATSDDPIQFAGIPQERFDDVIGLGRAKRRLGQVISWMKNPDLLGGFAVKPPRGFLLSGPPGTGKTLLARAFAGEADLPFLAVSPGDLQSKYVGDSEKRIRQLFEQALEFSPAIIFLDEFDGIARRRSEGDGHHSRSVINQFLACMDGFSGWTRPVFVLAATNHVEDLDPAVLRPGRFDEVLPIDRPNTAARRTFFERRLQAGTLTGREMEGLVIGTTGCTPAELDRIVREAAYLRAGTSASGIDAGALEIARRLVVFGAEREDFHVSDEEKRCTAYHEAGHALVHIFLTPQQPVHFLTIVPNETGALGLMATLPQEDRHDLTLEAIEARLAVALAGREAERILAAGQEGLLTTGASADLRQATQLAWRAITEWGLDSTFGPIRLDVIPPTQGTLLTVTAQDRLKEWLNRAAQRARDILTTNQTQLITLAESLQANESMDTQDIAALSLGPKPST